MNKPVRRGLVLSGGGFFGAFQAGAYEVLGDFDCIAGASAGALNAWAIASGMPPAELQALWLRAAESPRGGLRLPRYWGDGFLDTSGLESMVQSLVREWRPRAELGVVVTQGLQFKQVLVRNAEIDAGVLLASCAVPFLIPAKPVLGRLSFDGGLPEVCPIWAGKAMGAEEIVAVNVWTPLPFWWPHRRSESSGARLIEPPRSLGPVRRSALADRNQVAEWIELGRQTARAAF